jgi:hypothetical protein
LVELCVECGEIEEAAAESDDDQGSCWGHGEGSPECAERRVTLPGHLELCRDSPRMSSP